MLKYISLICCSVMIFTACAGKSEQAPQEDPVTAMKRSLANYNNACADITLVQTKAKVSEADNLKASGDTANGDKVMAEAVEIFKVEEPKYLELNNSNEAQKSRHGELTSRRDTIDSNMASSKDKKKVKKWKTTLTKVNKHLDNAKKAIEKCDPEKAKKELDIVAALLDDAEGLVVVVTDTVAASGKVYVVKKGDSLWEIAGIEYSNPFMWPIIYWANKSQIKDPDLIFPGQNFDIIFEFAEEEKVRAVNLAKTRGPWSLYDNK